MRKKDLKEIEKLKKQGVRKDLESRQKMKTKNPKPNWKCNVCQQVQCLIVICLLSSFCLGELPPLESLSLKEQIIVAELSKDVMPDANLVIERAIALEEADYNNDGTIDLHDFARFQKYYSLFQNKPVVDKKPTTDKTVVFQDANTIVYRYGEVKQINYGDFNDLSFVNYYLNEYLDNGYDNLKFEGIKNDE